MKLAIKNKLFYAVAIVMILFFSTVSINAIDISVKNSNLENFQEPQWAMRGNNPQRTGLSKYFSQNNPGELKWKYYGGWDSWSQPSIAADGTIYFATNGEEYYWDITPYLHAVNSDGSLKWKVELPGSTYYSSPAIASDGTIYIGCENLSILAINPDGTIKWKFDTDGEVLSSPAISEDGTIYVGSGSSYMYAINPDGTLKWKVETSESGNLYSSPAIGPDGTIYIGDRHHRNLYAINPNGELEWVFPTGESVYDASETPVVGSDGTIYFTNRSGHIFAINPDGSVKWQKKYYPVAGSIAIGSDNTLYVEVGFRDGVSIDILALNPDGSKKWNFSDEGYYEIGSPVITADGVIYVSASAPDHSGQFYAINPDGTLRWKYREDVFYGTGIGSSPSIGIDGTVYYASLSGYLYAINERTSNNPPGKPDVKVVKAINYTAKTTDPDGNDICYYFNLFVYDPINDEYVHNLFRRPEKGFVSSGTRVGVNFIPGLKKVYVMAVDEHGYNSVEAKLNTKVKYKNIFTQSFLKLFNQNKIFQNFFSLDFLEYN